MTRSGLFEEGAEPSYEDVLEVTETMARTDNFKAGKVIKAGEENVGDNIMKIGYRAPIMRPAAMLHEDTFRATLAAHPELSENDVKQFEEVREDFIVKMFPEHSKVLENSSLQDEWLTALQRGRTQGVEDHEILQEFIQDEEINCCSGIAVTVLVYVGLSSK